MHHSFSPNLPGWTGLARLRSDFKILFSIISAGGAALYRGLLNLFIPLGVNQGRQILWRTNKCYRRHKLRIKHR